MKPNFLDIATGEEILISNYKLKIIDGERVYFDANWNKLAVIKLGKVQNIGVRTQTKNRI